MWQIFTGLAALILFSWVAVAFYFAFLYVILPLIGIGILYFILHRIYLFFNSDAKQRYLERKSHRKQEYLRIKEQEANERRLTREQETAKLLEKELRRIEHRDSNQQDEPYTYTIGRHANETLAIRYGIANQEKMIKEYWYYAKGGIQRRNSDRDKVYYIPSKTIRLQKTKKVKEDMYEVLLSDFRDRKALAIIETGTEYIKTFYPLDADWFDKHSELEKTLKGNKSFTLKELATFHVQKAIGI